MKRGVSSGRKKTKTKRGTWNNTYATVWGTLSCIPKWFGGSGVLDYSVLAFVGGSMSFVCPSIAMHVDLLEGLIERESWNVLFAKMGESLAQRVLAFGARSVSAPFCVAWHR